MGPGRPGCAVVGWSGEAQREAYACKEDLPTAACPLLDVDVPAHAEGIPRIMNNFLCLPVGRCGAVCGAGCGVGGGPGAGESGGGRQSRMTSLYDQKEKAPGHNASEPKTFPGRDERI